ncbi:TGF-beta-activated kinase 1 and MAP3K7-binding protein 3 isoform X1 [Xiphophorus couchianus]|uniref:TGF-beta-activated kinase 1 and MAP3K7-binding protein 3 isoform X1 n=1 Tax=Xiphophorus couchianus TaxID=32473 RepID=UPI001016DF9C|nr:TGF-beta-activated kinase 1 and MAP3K7-binding protein 3 isoform X1 [Xiphophorus couchianus]XP_027883405.1 TGF-beta-activated kinase 1 and MAP3K7-binding protein 3 isoform X1 [Xiphophorus couchianus]
MAQGGSQVDYHILQDLKQRFPEIPEGVVSQFLLQNNNNLDVCCHLLSQESNRYLYGDFHHSPEEMRMSRNHMLHISLGYPGSEAGKSNGGGAGVGRSLVHSTSDGHIDPQRPSYPEPLSAPATMAPSPSYNPFFMNDQSRSSSTPTPPPTMQGMSPTYTPVPRYPMNPISVTLPQTIPTVHQALQIPPGHYVNSTNSTLYIRPSPSQSPQPAPWPSPGAPVYQHQQSPYSTPTYGSPYSSPQHQVQPQPQPQPGHQQYVFLPISPPNLTNMPYHHQQQPPAQYRPYQPKTALTKQIEIALEGQRPRSNSPVHTPHSQGSLYMATSPSPSSPSRPITIGGPPGPATFHPGMYLQHQGNTRPRQASSPQPGQSAYTFKIKVSPGGQVQRPPSSPPVAEAESLLNIVDQGAHSATPAPILPISALPGNIASQFQQLPRRSSSASDDYAYTQALLLHQRARMERLEKELHMETQKLDQLKTDVNNMEYDALQRRFRRVNSTHLVPRPEEITRLRTHNRQLQIDIDCTLKETDLLQSRGKFDPKAMSNFYDNIQPGPLGPTNPGKKEGEQASKPTPQRDEDFEGAHWNCDSCTLLNHPALNRCEACEMPRYS